MDGLSLVGFKDVVYLHLKFWYVPNVVQRNNDIWSIQDDNQNCPLYHLEANIEDNKIPITSIKWNVGNLEVNSQVN